VRADLPTWWRGGLGVLLRLLRPLLGVLFTAAVRRRRAATINLFEQKTESMSIAFLSDFGSRVTGGMRHCWLRSASGPRRARAVVRAPPRQNMNAFQHDILCSNFSFQKRPNCNNNNPPATRSRPRTAGSALGL